MNMGQESLRQDGWEGAPPAPEGPSTLECERSWIYLTLMCVGGYFGAFTYVLRGGVFCNAQTGNILLFGMALGEGAWSRAAYYLIPMSAYFLGAVVSEALPGPIRRRGLIRWDTLLVLVEMVVVALLGLLPESAPYQISQVAVNFICSMQYNTFRQAGNIPMATTFCTNHVRQAGVAAVKAALDGDAAQGRRMLAHFSMLAAFVVGAAVSTVLCGPLQGRAIWVALIPLTVVFVRLLRADLTKERGTFDRVPKGH